MKILFAASECAPMAKVGGLGDVIGSLPKALSDLGADVRIVMPRYGVINKKKYPSKQIAAGIMVGKEAVAVYRSLLPGTKIILYFIDSKRFFSQNHIYFERTAFVGSIKEIERFLFFSKAIPEIFSEIKWLPDVIHCHDWHVSMIPPLLKIRKQPIKTLLTIHNLANQGKWRAGEILKFLGLEGDEMESFGKRSRDGDLNILEQGILNADMINAVSERYKKEILTREYGEGLEASLRKRKKDLYGILNGLDVKAFDPKADPFIKINYSFKNLEKKIKNKIELQKILGFQPAKEIFLCGVVNRLTGQKGIDLIIKIIPRLAKMDIQLVILGVGAKEYEKELTSLGKKYPKNVSVEIKFDPVLAQRIYAGCDAFLMPSRFEPCGLGQMIAMRYGTVPIVRKTGGLADTVRNGETGFVFEKYGSESLLAAVKYAQNSYNKKDFWRRLAGRGMRQDFSWRKSAKNYLRLYKKLTRRRAGFVKFNASR